MINRTVLVGRLTRDPELRVSQNNVSVTTFNLAVNRPFTSKDGEQQADFINCVTFRKQAENVNQYVKKGSLVGIDGRIQTRNYENKEGQRVYVTEVVCDSVQFLEPKAKNQGSQQQNIQTGTNTPQRQNNATQGGYEQNPFANANGPVDIKDDDLPF